MNKVYLMYAIDDIGEYSGPIDSVEYVADSKDEITRLANNYIREDLGFDDWKDKTYEEFNDVVEVNDVHAIRVEEFPLYTGFNVNKLRDDGKWIVGQRACGISKWIHKFADNGWMDHVCANCGFVENTDVHVNFDWSYCPSCGSLMEL